MVDPKAPHGRNRNGVPKRPNSPTVITIQSCDKAYAIEWGAFILNNMPLLDALPLAIVKIEDWPVDG